MTRELFGQDHKWFTKKGHEIKELNYKEWRLIETIGRKYHRRQTAEII